MPSTLWVLWAHGLIINSFVRACCQAIKRLVNGFALVPRMAAVSRADDDRVPGHPGTVSEALLSVLRRRGLEEFVGLLCFMKVRSRAAFAELEDLRFEQPPHNLNRFLLVFWLVSKLFVWS